MKNPFLFDLAKSKPLVDKKKSGSVRGAYEKNFPVASFQMMLKFLWLFVYVKSPMMFGGLSTVPSDSFREMSW